MSNKLHQVALGREAREYIRECLTNGLTLSQELVPRLAAFSNASSLLPENVDLGRARQLKYGGKLSARKGERVADSGSTRVPDTLHELVELVMSYLEEREDRLFVLENRLARPGDSSLSKCVSQLLIFRQEVYHCVRASARSRVAIAAALREARTTQDFVGILTLVPPTLPLPGDEKYELSRSDIELIAKGTERIVVGAYDGEGFLLSPVMPLTVGDGTPSR